MVNIRAWRTLRKWGRKWRDNLQCRAGILLYHRVTQLDSDPQLLCVSPRNFEEHLRILHKSYHVLSLQEFVQNFSRGRLPSRTLVLTFDDGYSDNLYQAKPTLERYNIPATVFITTGATGQSGEFWWDDLERLLLKPAHLPEQLSLSLNNHNYFWQLGLSSYYNKTEYQIHRQWHVLRSEDPTPRHRIYRTLCEVIRLLPREKQQVVVQKLTAWAGVDTTGRTTHRALTPPEIQQLAVGNLIEIGAHSKTHSVLSAISREQQWVEVQESKAYLELLLDQPVSSFSYPYGTQFDYTAETITTLQDTGFVCACSNFPDLIRQDTDHFQLPRFLIRNWSGDEFAYRLQQWFNGEIPKPGSY